MGGFGEGMEIYRLFMSSSLPRPSVMLSPRMMKALAFLGAHASITVAKYLSVQFFPPLIPRRAAHQCFVLVPVILVAFTLFPVCIQLVVRLPGWPVILLPACPFARYILSVTIL